MQYAQQRSSSSNAIGIGLVVVLHLGVGYALLMALGSTYTPTKIPTTYAKVFDEPKKQEVELPKTFDVRPESQKTVFITMPDIKPLIRPDTPPPTGATTEIPHDTYVGPATPASASVPDKMTGPIRLAGPSLLYPSRLKTMGMQGWVDIQCDVNEFGGTSNCSMIAHEGAMAFVDEALDYVKATRYSPATRNGVAVTEKGHRFHIEFKLTDN